MSGARHICLIFKCNSILHTFHLYIFVLWESNYHYTLEAKLLLAEARLSQLQLLGLRMADWVASTFQAAASGSQAMGTVATGFRLMSQSPGFGVAGREAGTTFVAPLQAKAPDPTPLGPSVTESGPSWSMKASGTATSGEDVAFNWDASGHPTTD